MFTRNRHYFKLLLALVIACAATFAFCADNPNKPVRLAVLNTFSEVVSSKYYDGSVELIAYAVRPSQLEVKLYDQEDFIAASEAGEFDLAIASSGLTSLIMDRGGTVLLSMISAQAPDPNFGTGAVVVTTADRDDINTFADLVDKRLSVISRRSFAGYFVPLKEIENNGVDLQSIVPNIRVTNDSMIQVLRDVKMGRADAGFITTCLLENMQEQNLSADEFKIIGRRQEPNFFCATSTELYPSWMLSASPSFPSNRAREIVRLLVNMPPSPSYDLAWSVSTDYRKVKELMAPMQEIYRREDAVMWFLNENKWYFVGGGIVILIIFLNSIYVGMRIRKRTNELNSTMQEKLAVELENQKNLARIESLQRVTAVGLISSTVAHELKQPLAVINNYVEGLKRRLQRNDKVDKKLLLDVIDEIEAEGTRAANIVEMVRSYRKTQTSAGSEVGNVDLAAVTERVVDLMKKSGQLQCHYVVDLAPDVYVRASPMDIELIIMNLIRNAFDAMAGVQSPLLQVTLRKQGHDAILTVTDNGPVISDEQLERMNNAEESTKREGLGLGLAIVKQILEAAAGSLRIVKNKTTGLSCIVKIPLANQNSGKVNGKPS